MKLTLETTPGSKLPWFVFGAIAGFCFATWVAVQTLYVLVAQGVL